MAYAHAQHGEHCAKCNDLAARVVGTQPLCLDHFANFTDSIAASVKRQFLIPRDITPDGFAAWADFLDHGIYIGAITATEARDAWNSAREFAA